MQQFLFVGSDITLSETAVVRPGLPAGVKVEPAGGMTEAMALHEKALETRFRSILFHLVNKVNSPSGLNLTPAGQTAKGSCDRIRKIDGMIMILAGVKSAPAGGKPGTRTLHANMRVRDSEIVALEPGNFSRGLKQPSGKQIAVALQSVDDSLCVAVCPRWEEVRLPPAAI